ncbi:DUF2752 domain-containing protein [Pseudobacter ginsenosidimutans]|jgi:hypothetical protein|uniref:Uncharacterized protein DUF2752 n=1 Tax=Pseudobacter ginsenosidimutans TaxID=661488 RepID=A0A4Q7MZP0_9BACT|nr:DUF2752 domain-containing protein [Pseudobacter ginsenosidimutans]QEC43001.1 DUF2752 domain-containing protein [Pseudobacter ginsenosidimutans]RZS74352.1 uncharacterized protein DUF2752 [Pseudobacter ginsenosidimutans]
MFLWMDNFMLPCMYKQLFNVDCPMCGAQRSLAAALKGDFASSFYLYPPLVPVLVLIVLSLLWLCSKRIVSKRFLVNYAWTVLALVMISYIVKLFIYPHSITS